MLTVKSNSTDPFFNLALEEYLLKELDLHEDFVLVWRNKESVIIGRNQNPYNEVNLQYTTVRDIPVIRRMTGGGTVFHDLGNVNFSFITRQVSTNLNNYRVFLDPIIDILKHLGVDASFHPESDIYIGDKKISGNAQTFYKKKMIHHGTLLFYSNTLVLEKSLKSAHKFDTHSVDSRPSTTTNIKEHLDVDMDIEQFMEHLRLELLDGSYAGKVYQLDDQDLARINDIVNTKYSSWDWNFGQSPEFIVKKEFENRMLITLIVRKGIIDDVTVDGFDDVYKIEEGLLGSRFEEEDLRHHLKDCNIDIEGLIQTLLYK